MRYIQFIWLILVLEVPAQPYQGNSRYELPDRIVGRNGTSFGYQSQNWTDLIVSGYYWETRQYEDSILGASQPLRITMQGKIAEDARKVILKEAAKHRVLLINESHGRPEHRIFTKSLLPELKKLGYDVLMAEAFRIGNNINQNHYPVATDGNMLNEPAYGSLVRFANQIGYTIEAYENDITKPWDDSIRLDQYGSVRYIRYEPRDSLTLLFNEHGLQYTMLTNVREKSQASNILKAIQANPGSKFVIHVGHGHLYEDGPMMGAQLRKLLKGEDVLTIDQTLLSGRVPITDTLSNVPVTRPFTMLIKDTMSNTYYHAPVPVDFTIVSKPVLDSLGRPDYLFEDVEKRAIVRLPHKYLNDCPCLFIAYYKNEWEKEKDKAIAADIVHVPGKLSASPLLLPTGKYYIFKKTKDGINKRIPFTVK